MFSSIRPEKTDQRTNHTNWIHYRVIFVPTSIAIQTSDWIAMINHPALQDFTK